MQVQITKDHRKSTLQILTLGPLKNQLHRLRIIQISIKRVWEPQSILAKKILNSHNTEKSHTTVQIGQSHKRNKNSLTNQDFSVCKVWLVCNSHQLRRKLIDKTIILKALMAVMEGGWLRIYWPFTMNKHSKSLKCALTE